MSFFGPWLLLGLLAAAIPPVIHLIHKRKAVVVRFPALEFIRRSNKKTARTFRLRQILLMLLRSALLAGLAFAMARPFVDRGAAATAALGGMQGVTVFVVDATWPMAYRQADGISLYDQARFQVETLLGRLAGPAGLVVARDRAEVVVGEPTEDLESVRRPLAELAPGSRVGALPEAVARAYDVLGEVPAGVPRRVVVLTTPAGAAQGLPSPPAGSGVEQVVVDVSEGQALSNRAVLDVALRPAPELGAGQWRVDARVGNFSNSKVDQLPVALEVEGKARVRGFISLEAGAEGTKTFYARLEDRAEPARAAVVIAPDGLPADDRRDFWLQPAPRIRVLAVNGDPKPTPQLDELFYFERAVAPRTAADARVQLSVVDADSFEGQALDEVDVVLLANVPQVSAAQARRLEAFVRAGGGLWITGGDRVDREAMNRALAGVLPRSLRDVRQAGDAAAVAGSGDRRSERLGGFDRGHPVLRPFADPAASSLARAQIRRYLLLDPAPDAGGEVVLSLEGGAPFLLTRALEEGRVALWTGTLDREWGDLCIRPDFVPLVQQVLRYLTRVASVEGAPVLVGRPAPLPVEDPRVRRVQVKTPEGALHTVDRPASAELAWVFTKTDRPGHYGVVPDPPLPGLAVLPGFSVAVDSAGSDLRGPAVAAPAASEGAEVRAALAGGRRTELWHAALLALFLVLLAEAGLLYRRRQARPDAFSPVEG